MSHRIFLDAVILARFVSGNCVFGTTRRVTVAIGITNGMAATANVVIYRTITQVRRRRDQIGTEAGKG